MLFASWSRRFKAGWEGAHAGRKGPTTKRALRRRSFLPKLEMLEGRLVPSITNVNTDTEGGYTTPHDETSIAVNPTNPLNMIGSANDFQATFDANGNLVSVVQLARAHVTFDGGTTWEMYEIPFPKEYTHANDPAVAFDADGTAYLATGDYSVLPNGDIPGVDIVVSHSSNGGKKWSRPELVGPGSGTELTGGLDNDKPYVAAWGHGNAIVTWTQFNVGPDGSDISGPCMSSVTHDGGKTWTTPTAISGPWVVTEESSMPVVAADGKIYVSFESWDEEVAPEYRDHWKVVQVDPATGQALGMPVNVSLIYDGIHDYPVNTDGRRTYQDSQFREATNGNITADPTNANHLALIWADMRNNPYPDGLLPSSDPYQVRTNSDIIVSQSFDAGKTWSKAKAIEKPNDEFQPWGAYDAHGLLQIGFYDRSYDPANHKYGYTLASEKTPDSLKFTFQQVTTALSDPTRDDAYFFTNANPNFPNAPWFIGDFSNIAISPYGVAAFWTDKRLLANDPPPFIGWGQDAFFALVDTIGSLSTDRQGSAGSLAGGSPPSSSVPLSSGTLPLLGNLENGRTPAMNYAESSSEAARTSPFRSAVTFWLPTPVGDSGQGLNFLLNPSQLLPNIWDGGSLADVFVYDLIAEEILASLISP